MSLSREQKKDLNQLGEYFRQIEHLAVENKLDLDVFMSEYNADGFAVYATEKVIIDEVKEKRKEAFQKSGKDQKGKVTR